MDITRRGFLGLLASTVLTGCARGSDSSLKGEVRTPIGMSPDEERLVKYYFPMLKRNEAKTWTFSTIMDKEKDDVEPDSFPFYHKTGDKITVGYGVNVEANGELLSDIPIYHSGEKLSDTERTVFLDRIKKKTPTNWDQYAITREDAEYLGKKAMLKEIRNAARVLTRDGSKNTFLYELPFCMQAMAVDICYNIGGSGFREYKKFKAALLARDYDKALSESLVYTDKKKKTFNKKREWSKKRLLKIMRLVQGNSSLGEEKIRTLLQQDYDANTSWKRRMGNCHTKLPHEILIATAELECVQNALSKARKIQQAKPAPVQPPKPAAPKTNTVKQAPQKQARPQPRTRRTGRGG